MDWKILLPVMVGTLTALIGWPIVHYFNLRREIAADKRKTRITYLIEAYRKIENAGNRGFSKGSDLITDIETAIADIQLLGTPEQVRLAQEFCEEFSRKKAAQFDPILCELRQSLRKELELEHVDKKLKFLRIVFD